MFLTVPESIKCANLELDENGMVKLTKENALKVENLISMDARYRYSSAKQMFDKSKDISNYSLPDLIEFIKRIAKDNSTRTANADIRILTKYIYDNLSNALERIKQGDLSLVDELANLSNFGASRKESSLASKICRYIDEWYYGSDIFTINDSVVRTMLPYYYLYYDIDFKGNIDKMTYVDFMKYFVSMVEKVRSVESSITRHEIDHILWYVYRNDSIRKAVASAIVIESRKAKSKIYIGCPHMKKETVVFPNISENNVIF